MAAYLIDRKPARDQFAARTTWAKSKLTGLTVLHTAEGVMDTVGPDTGAEATAEFIRTRKDPGSYHDLVDSDSWLPLVPYHLGAYQDGTGSNGFALSISFACKTTDWARMSPAKRRGFLHQGARAFANQQLYLRSVGAPLTRLRLISKAQSDAGMSGLIYHGHRDPGRRTDPGTTPAAPFPLDEFIAECRGVLATVMPDHPDAGPTAAPAQEDDMPDPNDLWTYDINGVNARDRLQGTDSLVQQIARTQADHGWALGVILQRDDVDEDRVAQLVVSMIRGEVTAAVTAGVADGRDIDAEAIADAVEQRVRGIFGDAAAG